MAFPLIMTLLILSKLILKPTFASIGECNFEKYATGCYSPANFICDRFTNQCKCHPESPVLIEQRICVKRAKTNEICQYNEQCDKENGFYCVYSDETIVNNSISPLREFPRCRNLYTNETLEIRIQKLHQEQIPPHQSAKQFHSPTSHHYNSSPVNHLPRLLWIFLIGCLLGLIILLLLIKSQYNHYQHHNNLRRPPFQHQEDRLSINSEIDVPPSYEVAIRMKL